MKKTSDHVKISFVVVILTLVVFFGILTVHHFGNKDRLETSDVQKVTSTVQSKNTFPKDVKSTDWDLVLVNKKHPLSAELNFNKVTVDDKQIDARIEQPLANFRQAAQKAGYATTLVSGYRAIAYQKQIFDNSVAQYEANGLSATEAKNKTALVIQTPGASEHHTGLAVDLAGDDALAAYPALQAEMDQYTSQKWLIQHAPDYGFVLRFLSDAKSIQQTGIDYESWHFRYVGVANAKYMTQHHLTLEAYVAALKKANR
ncbi:MAG: M15 family metallopeptidase [Leuconostoc pseudomesenteroides]|uniref:M15 family metallopeptidase n=1 Tax=Leuconostoc pseudomesenteroides TaxID=33968 RepID=UPI0039EBD9CB